MLTHLILSIMMFSVADKSSDLKIHASAYWPFAEPRNGGELVFYGPTKLAIVAYPSEMGQTEADQKKAVAEVMKALKVENIDWTKHMLIMIVVPQVHPKYGIENVRVEKGDVALIVHYGYCAPVAARPQDKPPKPTVGSMLLLVDRTEGEVKFKCSERNPK